MNQTQDLEDALFEAAKSGNLDQVQQLVESGADVNAVDGHHITPFFVGILRWPHRCCEIPIKQRWETSITMTLVKGHF